jgi:hypothetical protein
MAVFGKYAERAKRRQRVLSQDPEFAITRYGIMMSMSCLGGPAFAITLAGILSLPDYPAAANFLGFDFGSAGQLYQGHSKAVIEKFCPAQVKRSIDCSDSARGR